MIYSSKDDISMSLHTIEEIVEAKTVFTAIIHISHNIDESIWLSQTQICEVFGKAKSIISEHTKTIFEEGELDIKQLFGNSEQFKQKETERLQEM